MSENPPAVQITKHDAQNYGVVLPFTESEFKDFLRELLGQPRTREQEFLGPFVIERNDVGHLHSLIHERIRQQNAGHLVAFHAKVALSDGTATTVNSIEELLTYHELRSSSPVWLTIIWTYLITFADKNHPEKQEIEISFDTGESTDFKRKYLSRTGEASIKLEIRHTARTFGLDLLALLGP